MGSSEEIYWNMAKNNRKLDAKMPSCPHCVAQGELSFFDFIVGFVFVLMIGLVNLSVSFALALKVSLKSRDADFGNFFSFVNLLFHEVKNKPREFFFPLKRIEVKN